jgi:hypothetical protein
VHRKAISAISVLPKTRNSMSGAAAQWLSGSVAQWLSGLVAPWLLRAFGPGLAARHVPGQTRPLFRYGVL